MPNLIKKLDPDFKNKLFATSVTAVVFGSPLVIYLIASFYILPTTQTEITVKLIKSERINLQEKNISGNYRYFTSSEVLENRDSLQIGKLNSADIHGQFIENEGKTCTVEVYGWRNEFFSRFKNIKTIKNCK